MKFLKSGTKKLIFAFVILSTQAKAQTLSLNEVLEAVERNNPLIASYNYKISAANALASGARSWMPPMIGIGFDQTPYRIANNEGFFNRNEGSVLVFLEQDIPNPAKLKAKQNYLSSLAAIDSTDIGFTKNQLFTEAKTAYIERFIAEKRLKIIKEEFDLLDLMFQSSINEYTLNQSDLTTIYKLQARQHTLEAMEAHEVSAIKEATVKLNYLMNLPQGTTFTIDSIIPFHGYKLSNLDTTTAFIASRRNDILKIERTVSAMRLNNLVTLLSANPDFGIRYEHFDMFGNRNAFSLMGWVTIPIAPWSVKNYKSESRSIVYQIEAMNFEKQNRINEARSAMYQALLLTMAEYEEVYHYEKEIIPAYKKAFQTGLLAYRENTGTLMSSLLAWDDLIMAQTEYLYHLEQTYKAEITYESTIEKR
ncbi:MAG: TolC family protein [Chitinophagales bacterium]|nr:TolC family protein [Chitinophagales bacterium]